MLSHPSSQSDAPSPFVPVFASSVIHADETEGGGYDLGFGDITVKKVKISGVATCVDHFRDQKITVFVDDGTGVLPCVIWLPVRPTLSVSAPRVGRPTLVMGDIKTFRTVRQLAVTCIREIPPMDEVMFWGQIICHQHQYQYQQRLTEEDNNRKHSQDMSTGNVNILPSSSSSRYTTHGDDKETNELGTAVWAAVHDGEPFSVASLTRQLHHSSLRPPMHRLSAVIHHLLQSGHVFPVHRNTDQSSATSSSNNNNDANNSPHQQYAAVNIDSNLGPALLSLFRESKAAGITDTAAWQYLRRHDPRFRCLSMDMVRAALEVLHERSEIYADDHGRYYDASLDAMY